MILLRLLMHKRKIQVILFLNSFTTHKSWWNIKWFIICVYLYKYIQIYIYLLVVNFFREAEPIRWCVCVERERQTETEFIFVYLCIVTWMWVHPCVHIHREERAWPWVCASIILCLVCETKSLIKPGTHGLLKRL